MHWLPRERCQDTGYGHLQVDVYTSPDVLADLIGSVRVLITLVTAVDGG